MRKVLFILGQLTDEDVEWIARTGRRVDAGANETLIRMGSRIADVVIILDGQAEVAAGDRVLATLGRGEVLGEMSLIENQPASASVRTLGPATLLLVPVAAIRAKLSADTPFAARFYKAVALFLADRMRDMIGRQGDNAVRRLEDMDELDDEVLDVLHLAGQRFLAVLDTASRANPTGSVS
jgi:CRP/FNR family transcriptional regulator, cyclic AMP receptor protein